MSTFFVTPDAITPPTIKKMIVVCSVRENKFFIFYVFSTIPAQESKGKR